MAIRSIPLEVKKKCIQLQKQGLNSKQIYTQYYSKLYNTKYSGFRTMMQAWKRKIELDDEILEVGNLSYGFTPHSTTVQIDRHGEIIQSWIKSKSEDSLYLELIENIKRLPNIEHEEYIFDECLDYMLEIPLYDLHLGISSYEYYRKTLFEILEIINSRNYKEIYFIIGQDLFHNDDFRGRTSSGTDIEKVDIAKAWNDARKFYYHLIDNALKHSQKIKVVYSKGNHDESMSWAFVQMIKAQYGNQIEVNDDTKDRKVITFGKNFIGITHGDNVKSRTKDLPQIFTMEYPQEFANSTTRELHLGHLHRESEVDNYGIMMRRLSTANKTDDWHYDKGFVGAHKRFMLFEWSKEKLKSIHYV